MSDGVFTDPKVSDVDGYLTVKIFHSQYWYYMTKEFCKRKKS